MVKIPYILNGETVFIPVNQLPPMGTGTVISYSPNYLHNDNM